MISPDPQLACGFDLAKSDGQIVIFICLGGQWLLVSESPDAVYGTEFKMMDPVSDESSEQLVARVINNLTRYEVSREPVTFTVNATLAAGFTDLNGPQQHTTHRPMYDLYLAEVL